jgi:hypothetical protein
MNKVDCGIAKNSNADARQAFPTGSAGDDAKTSVEMTTSNSLYINQQQQLLQTLPEFNANAIDVDALAATMATRNNSHVTRQM